MRKYNHIGIVTTTPQAGEFYAEGLKVHLTNFAESPNKIEFLRYEEGSPLPEILQTTTHIAYEVPSIAEELKVAKKILVEPFEGGENLMCAFVEEEGIAIELMEYQK